MDRLIQLRAFAQQDFGNDPLVLDLLDELLTRGLNDEARDLLSSLAPDRAALPAFAWRSSRLALQIGDFTGAAAKLHGLLEAGNDSAAIRHDLAFAYLCDRRLDDAERTLAPVIPQSITEPAIGILHGRILQHRRRLEDAALIVEAVVDDHPTLAEAWGLLAMLMVDLVRPDEARSAAEKALQLQEAQSDALTALGTLALWQRDGHAAYLTFSAILATQPDAGRALAGAGESLMLRGDIPGARAFLSRAVERMDNHIGTWHALAWCALMEGDKPQATICFDKAFVLDRNFGETHGGFAIISALDGRPEEARGHIKVAMRLDANGRNARFAQSLIWSGEGKEREAAAMVEGILADTGAASDGRGSAFIASLRQRLQGPDA